MGEAAFDDDVLIDSPARADTDPEFVANLRQALADGDGDLVRRMLVPLHEADIADVVEQLSANQQGALAELPLISSPVKCSPSLSPTRAKS